MLTNSLEFMAVFGVVFVFTGGFIQLGIALAIGLTAAYLVRKYLTNIRLPVPANSAILITGCSTGIGEDAALKLSDDGFMIFACVRKQSDVDSLKSKATSANQQRLLIPLIMDVTNEKQIREAVVFVREKLTATGFGLFGLINNAGVSNNSVMELVSQDTLKQQFEINVFAQVLVTQAFLPFIRAHNVSAPHTTRRIVFISSAVGWMTFPTSGPYCASKHAVEAIGDAFRMELKSAGIDVILVEPGAVRTAFRATAHANADRNIAGERSIFPASADVVAAYEKMIERYQTSRKKSGGAPVEIATDALRDCMLGSRPLPRIAVGKDANSLPFVLKLPDAVLDRIWPNA